LKNLNLLLLAIGCLCGQPVVAQILLTGEQLIERTPNSVSAPNGDDFVSLTTAEFPANSNYFVTEFNIKVFGTAPFTVRVPGDNVGETVRRAT
jgi:hypothetical protein